VKDALGAVMRLSLLRLRRSRIRWLVVAMCFLPILVALLTGLGTTRAADRWLAVGELTLRTLTLLLPTLLVAGTVGDELVGKTYSYLWSRPIPRATLLFGKLAATLPIMAVALVTSLSIAYGIVAATSEGAEIGWLIQALIAGLAGLVSASAFAIGLGTVLPKHALITVLTWVLLLEQALPSVPAAQNLTTLHHVRVLARLPGDVSNGTPLSALIGLALLTVFWMGLGMRRVKKLELSGEG
jgi:ABC-2 type transport system permease protein